MPNFKKATQKVYYTSNSIILPENSWINISSKTDNSGAYIWIDNVLVSYAHSSDEDQSADFAEFFAPLPKGTIIRWATDAFCTITIIPFSK